MFFPFPTLPQVLSGVSFGTPANATISTALMMSETLEFGADTPDPAPGLLSSKVGKATVKLRLDSPSKNAGPRCNECIVLGCVRKNAIVSMDPKVRPEVR